MPDDYAEIHFISGETLEVPGTVADVQSRLVTGRGGLVTLKDREGAEVSVNPLHVAFVKGGAP